MKHKPKKQIKTSLLTGLSSCPESIQKEDNNCFMLSFKYLDTMQGQRFIDWEKEGILSKAMDTLSNYCRDTIPNQTGNSFTIYGGFPPKGKTKFSHPKHVPPDANWARIHVQGRECVAGHVHHNVFYVVFLDKEHKFWINKLKHT